MGIVDDLARALYPGQQILRVNGWEGLKKFAMPWNSSAIFLDTDPNEDHFYIKSVDSAGHETMSRHKYYEDPVEEIDPSKYARKSDLEATKEEILSAIDAKFSELLGSINPAALSAKPGAVDASDATKSASAGPSRRG
jgi:hypothetical protein